MKKIICLVLSFIIMQSVYADFAKLRIKMTGVNNTTNPFLCVSNVGCVSIKAGNQGTTFAMNEGTISYIVPVSMNRLHMHNQVLPESCNTPIRDNQLVTISGHLTSTPSGDVKVSHMQCTIT